MFLHQQKFVNTLLMRFGMSEAKAAPTPIVKKDAARKTNRKEQTDEENLKGIPYRQAIGNLLYLTNGTQPVTTYAINVLSRRQSNYNKRNWEQVKRYCDT